MESSSKEEHGGWCIKVVKVGYGVGMWKAIRKERNLVTGKIPFVVGNGRMVLFWKDKWCGPLPLSVAYPTLLYAIAPSKDVLILFYSIVSRRGC